MNLAIVWAVCGLCAGFLLGFGWGVSVKCPTFPRPSQNQTVSSGVEGAHEGTTADEKAELPREHQCASANDCPLCDEYVPPKSGSREPGKLNNAPDPLDYFLVTYGFDGNNHARQMLISCWAAARQYERKQAAESSL